MRERKSKCSFKCSNMRRLAFLRSGFMHSHLEIGKPRSFRRLSSLSAKQGLQDSIGLGPLFSIYSGYHNIRWFLITLGNLGARTGSTLFVKLAPCRNSSVTDLTTKPTIVCGVASDPTNQHNQQFQKKPSPSTMASQHSDRCLISSLPSISS